MVRCLTCYDCAREFLAVRTSKVAPKRCERVKVLDAAVGAQGFLDSIDVVADSELVAITEPLPLRDDLNFYSILAGISTDAKRDLLQAVLSDDIINRCVGSMCGMAIADALGHPFEFLPVQEKVGRRYFDLSTMSFHGEMNKFQLKRGQWTDDAAMGLCVADSLILRRSFDGSDMRIRFWCWWYRGYNNAFRKDPIRSSSVGLGGNISKSLEVLSSCRNRKQVSGAYGGNSEDSGNGSLLRLSPIALFCRCRKLEVLYDTARRSSYTTHPGVLAAEACAFLAHLIVRAVNAGGGVPPDARQFLDEAASEYLELSGLSKQGGAVAELMKCLVASNPQRPTETCWNWKADELDISGSLNARGSRYNGYPNNAGYFGSYCMDGLAVALWSVYHTTTFDEAVARSVNFLGDADSIGSITGQIAGALYGYSTIHPQFVDWLTVWDDHEFAIRAILLHHLSKTL